jgi:hypothetical protein
MRYSPDLPLEEQQRLDQMHLGMQGGTRTGLDSMFNNAGRLQEYQSQSLVEEWRKNRPQGLGTNLTSLIAQPITSLPRPDVIGPAVMRPAVMPQPEVFKPIGRRGGNFLNRFERLLDGLEGLVGKLGGESKPDPSPLVDPVGGIGSISPTPTPFTASQDY